MDTSDSIRARIDVLIKPYIEDEAARHVAVGMIATFRTLEKLYSTEQLDDELRGAVLRIVLDFTLDFPANPFWMQHGMYVMPVFSTAINAWLDMPVYGAQIGNGATDFNKESMLRAEAMRAASVEVAAAVLYKSAGAAAARTHAKAMRDALLNT